VQRFGDRVGHQMQRDALGGFGLFRTKSDALIARGQVSGDPLDREGVSPTSCGTSRPMMAVFRRAHSSWSLQDRSMAEDLGTAGRLLASDPIEVELGSNASERRRWTSAWVAASDPCINRKGEALPANCKVFDGGGSEVPSCFLRGTTAVRPGRAVAR